MGKFTVNGTAKDRGIENVDPRLVDTIRRAAANSPYDVELFSGKRYSGGQHAEGRAVDIVLRYPKTGRAIPNLASKDSYEVYEGFAKAVRAAQQEFHPKMPIRWGGGFSPSKRNPQGFDLMHFDVRSDQAMTYYDWEKGITPAGKAALSKLGPGQIYSAEGEFNATAGTTYENLWEGGRPANALGVASGESDTVPSVHDTVLPPKGDEDRVPKVVAAPPVHSRVPLLAVRTRRPPIPLGGWSYADFILRSPELMGGAGFDSRRMPLAIPSENEGKVPPSANGIAPGFWPAGTTPDAHGVFGDVDLSGAADFVLRENGVISKGAEGEEVRQIQRFLIAHGYTDDIGRPLVEDGRFTPFTRQALKKYQRRHSPLDADGKLGRATFEQMIRDNQRPITQWFDETHGPTSAPVPTTGEAADPTAAR